MSLKKIYFMAGLPRSGSTLLSSILNQNPKFYSGPNSSVLNMMISMDNFRNDDMFKAHPNTVSLETILRSIILNFYYYNVKPICIDKNRGWTGYMEYIIKYIDPNPKIICPVRDIKSVLTSFIDRKSTRLNSSHQIISYAVFCLKQINHLNVTDA